MNVLLNINNFSEDWAYDSLKDIIQPWMKVLIIPWSYHEEWIHNARQFDEHYRKGREEFEDIAREFMNYGISRRNISVAHYYRDPSYVIRSKIRRADIIFLTGGYPAKFLYRIDAKRIRRALQNFGGVMMGTSAGAMIQFDKYHVTPEEEGQDYEYHEGLGLLSGFDIEVHFEESFEHLASLVTDLNLHGIPIFALPNRGGMIVDGEDFELLGDAFLIESEDVEVLQEELDQLLQEEFPEELDRMDGGRMGDR